jgi:hypothetical protein
VEVRVTLVAGRQSVARAGTISPERILMSLYLSQCPYSVRCPTVCIVFLFCNGFFFDTYCVVFHALIIFESI